MALNVLDQKFWEKAAGNSTLMDCEWEDGIIYKCCIQHTKLDDFDIDVLFYFDKNTTSKVIEIEIRVKLFKFFDLITRTGLLSDKYYLKNDERFMIPAMISSELRFKQPTFLDYNEKHLTREGEVLTEELEDRLMIAKLLAA